MLVAKLLGGLGNQMFQYACVRNLAIKNGTSFKLDLTSLLSRIPRKEFTFRDYELGVFDLSPDFTALSKLAIRFNNLAFVLQYLINKLKFILSPNLFLVEKSPVLFEEIKINSSSNTFLSGQWSSEKYFIEIEDVIRRDFTFKQPLSDKNLKLSKIIELTESVSIHIRRGDYVTLGIDEICNLDYYKKSINYICTKIINPTFFIFSDDIDWVKKNLIVPGENFFINHNKGTEAYMDMRLMSMCKHNIIANSSFSWWAAWLNGNKQKIVISPSVLSKIDLSVGTGDVVPKNWIKL